MEIVDYNNLKSKNLFFKFCKNITEESSHPAAKNMWADNWKSNPESLPYLLETKRFFAGNHGKFYVAYDHDNIVGCSGVYKAIFNKKIAIAGARTWIDHAYRHQQIVREYFFPAQKEWAIEQSLDAILISVNDYNKNLLRVFTKKRLGEQRSPNQNHHLFYNNFNTLEFPVSIRNTKQWIAYEILNPSFNFDWTSIAWKD
jgi:hypothetical protein